MSKPEFSIPQVRDFVKKDYGSVSARFVKSLLQHYDDDLLGILIWYQSKGDIYRNQTTLEDCVKDYIKQKYTAPCQQNK